MKIHTKIITGGFYIWYYDRLFIRTYICFYPYGKILFFSKIPDINRIDEDIPVETVVKIVERYYELNGDLSESNYHNKFAYQALMEFVPYVKKAHDAEEALRKETKEFYEKLGIKQIDRVDNVRLIIEAVILITKVRKTDDKLEYANDKLLSMGIVCENQSALKEMLSE